MVNYVVKLVPVLFSLFGATIIDLLRGLPAWYYFSYIHYQKTDDSWRPKTVRNYRITDRNVIPDGQPSGICRQDSVVRIDHPFLTVGRQESFPDGISWRSTGKGGSGWIPDSYPSGTVVLAVRKSTMSSKKNTHAELHTSNSVCMLVPYTCPSYTYIRLSSSKLLD